MAAPDFDKKTIETLAKRAAFRCSNPDCRVNTVGPNSESTKSTTIGEAAHIFGARPTSKRYQADMTETARSEITNSIWLCRNCHKLIDSDDHRYTTNLLFAWRENHEKFISSEIGNNSDQILLKQKESELTIFDSYPPLIRRIVIDKPEGWEFRLTAELMRHLNAPIFRKLKDLKDGLYSKQRTFISEEEVMPWVLERLDEASIIFSPLASLIEKLNSSWGPLGEPGNAEEIHHISVLIRDHLEQIIIFEEKIYFIGVQDEYKKIVDLLKDVVGSQAIKLEEIPETLDGVIELINNDNSKSKNTPHIINKTIKFDVPINWVENCEREAKQLRKQQSNSTEINEENGCTTAVIIFIVILVFSCLFMA